MRTNPDSMRALACWHQQRSGRDQGNTFRLSRPNCVSPCNGCNQMQEFGLYLAEASSSDNALPRYNVNTFLNSATTRTFSLVSASSYSAIMPLTIWRDAFAASRDCSLESDGFFA